MNIHKNQILFLIEISKQDGKLSVVRAGRNVWNTAVSIYNNMNLLRDLGYITFYRRKNTIIPELTDKGKQQVKSYFEMILSTKRPKGL